MSPKAVSPLLLLLIAAVASMSESAAVPRTPLLTILGASLSPAAAVPLTLQLIPVGGSISTPEMPRKLLLTTAGASTSPVEAAPLTQPLTVVDVRMFTSTEMSQKRLLQAAACYRWRPVVQPLKLPRTVVGLSSPIPVQS